MYKVIWNVPGVIKNGMSIPPDEGNADYVRYLQWLEEGNSPEIIHPQPRPTSDLRLEEYLKQLKKRVSAEALTDIVEVIVTELQARGKAETEDFADLCAITDDIDKKYPRKKKPPREPKPEPEPGDDKEPKLKTASVAAATTKTTTRKTAAKKDAKQ